MTDLWGHLDGSLFARRTRRKVAEDRFEFEARQEREEFLAPFRGMLIALAAVIPMWVALGFVVWHFLGAE